MIINPRDLLNPVQTQRRINKSEMFKDLIKDINEHHHYIKPQVADTNFIEHPTYNTQALIDAIRTNSDDSYINGLIMTNYVKLLDDSNISKYGYQDLFTNTRFLNMISQLLYKVNITPQIQVCCNKLAYDFITSGINNIEIGDMLTNITRICNRDAIARLNSIGLPESLSIKLALSRYSSDKELLNIKRLNWSIATSDKELISEQKIIYIYEQIIDTFIPLFEGTMFDVYDRLPDDIEEIMSYTSLAILDILNNMPSDKIISILKTYTIDRYSIIHGMLPIRFSLQCLSPDYQRILDCIYYLQQTEQIYVP